MHKKSGFSLLEFLIVMTLISSLFMFFAPKLKTNFVNRQNDSYINRYCEIIDNALYSAMVENRLTRIRDANLEQVAPYIRGTLNGEHTSITMHDGTVITGGNATYTATFPTGLTHSYLIDDNSNHFFCRITSR